ncbi:SDR family oxidoreductase [Clavibacter sp. MX14-G9D]|uniref:SDR family oxidoreductase n=1 Tax=Clavibacter sp. MX14-G9D TaxID=3064656 RepID=UPI00293E87DC|nr:SDR family oxidoreductase [Clavibacter sp. MX14-G9D]
MPTIDGSVVLVTGANGGIGTQLVHAALERSAARVYASARSPRSWDDPRVVPLPLDVTDPASIRAAVEAAADVTILVNNAGANPPTPSLLDISDEDLRANMEVNFFAPVLLTRAFAPVLSAAEGAALIDIHSALSWYAVAGAYSASKAALWSATNSFRLELAPAGVHVVGVHVGYVDTAMAAGVTDPKTDPAVLAALILDATEAGEHEVLADATSVQVRAGLSAPLEVLYPQLAARSAD